MTWLWTVDAEGAASYTPLLLPLPLLWKLPAAAATAGSSGCCLLHVAVMIDGSGEVEPKALLQP